MEQKIENSFGFSLNITIVSIPISFFSSCRFFLSDIHYKMRLNNDMCMYVCVVRMCVHVCE